MTSKRVVIRSLLAETKDGEWGKEAPFDGSVEMAVIRGTDFDTAKNGILVGIPIRHIAGKAACRKVLQPGDILIETAGGSKGRPTGRTVYLRQKLFEQTKLPITCASFARFMRVDSALAEPEFVYWYLQYLYSSGVIENHQVQHTGIARFQFTKFADSTEITLPGRAMQQSIAALLGLLDDRITLLRETNTTLEAIAQALFKSWFVDFDPVRAKREGRAPEGMDEATAALFPDAFEESELGVVPRGWRVYPFTDIVNVIGGGTPKTSVSEYWNGDIPWFSVADAPSTSDIFVVDTEKHITQAGIDNSSTKLLPAGTTIISARGTVGRLALTGREMAMNQSCYGLRGKAGDAYFTYLCTYRLVETLKQRAHGSVFDTITRDTLSGVLSVFPGDVIVLEFEKLLSPVMERIRQNLMQVQNLVALRDALLPRLISGQIRLPEAEAEALAA
ncbi:restriction endonuclease subunit S [Burkholderia pseudomallei]|uniref:restriction endonuclease subunit S n=1 Tax=Burkholderia pseudomallei TaxID=28450 RepID=UPI0027DFB186|nr:restriction endonuclease subunit S [Burkholderia pseudomallei]